MPKRILLLTDHEAAIALAKQRQAIERGQAWQCPLCRRVTYHETDIAEEFCPCCGNAAMPKACPHRPSASLG